jgi:hypothetical protein
MTAFLGEMQRELEALASTDPTAAATRRSALEGVALLARATQSLGKALATRAELAQAVAVPYLKLCGYVAGGWLLARSAALAAAAGGADREFYAAKLHSAAFYASQVLPNAAALARVVESGAASVVETDAALI